MASNQVQLNEGSGSKLIATETISGKDYGIVKLADGTAGSTAQIPGDATNGLYVNVKALPALPVGSNAIGSITNTSFIATQATGSNLHTVVDSGTITTVSAVTAISNALPAGTNLMGKVGIDQTTVGTTNGVSLAQIGTTTVSTGNGTVGAGVQRVAIASDNTAFSVNSVQSGTWNITNVSGTISLPTGAATSAKQPALGTAGTASSDVITVQGIASMTALKVDNSGVTQPISAASLPLPTGASTAAKQPALGTAGTASSDVLSVQGIASMTALKTDGSAVTQPVSGTITANAGTGTFIVAGAKTNNNAAPGATNIGALTALANAAAPSWTEGNLVALSTDLSGQLRVTGSLSVGGTTDNSVFTAGTSTGTPSMGFYHSTIDTVTDGRAAALAIDSKRNLFTVLRDAAGNARGANINASNQLSVSVDNTLSVTATQATGTNLHTVVDSGTITTVSTVTAVTAITNALPAGTNLLGKTGIDQTTPGTTNAISLAQIGANTVLTGNGVAGTGAQRVTIASDNTAFSVNANLMGLISTNNSSTSTLLASATFTGTSDDVTNYVSVTIQVFADQTGTLNYEFSNDNTNWDTSFTAAITASTTKNVTISPTARYFRIRYVNGGTNQGAFRLQTIYKVTPANPALVDTTADGTGTSTTGFDTRAKQMVYNGTTWDRQRSGGATGSVAIGGSVATNTAITANPINLGAQAVSSENAAVTTARQVQLVADLVGKLIVLPYANPENFVSGAITSAMTGTTSTSLVAAPGAGLRNYITTIIVSNSHATVGTDIIIQDGSGGATLLTIPASAVYGGAVITLPTPLRQPTTNTALFCANVTTGASTKVSAVGYKGA